jgi:dCMP deaminase
MTEALIAYVPALHKGYIDFFKKYPNASLYLLGKDLVLEYPRMERDIRAIDPEEMKKIISSLGIFSTISVLSKENLDDLKNFDSIAMPSEDISRMFAEKYLSGKKMTYVSTFLRWDGHNAQKSNIPVNPNRKISTDAFDKEIMNQAYEQAPKSPDWWRQIGAIVVKDKKIIYTGFNRPLPSDQTHNIFGDPRSDFDYGVNFELSKFLHAEAGIIARAAKDGISLDGTSVYVTTFPCPVCAKSIATAGIKKVYYTEGYSLLDAEDILKTFDIEIIQVQL